MTTERRITTERKREAARANGAKSRGPVTAAGKAQSSKNSVKHGLTSAVTIILPGESEDQFRRERADLARTLQPVNDAEAKLVEDIANLQWQMSRAIRMNSHLLNLQIDVIADSVDQETTDISPEAQIALAFQSLVQTSTALPTLDRHLAHLRRQHKYLRDELTRLQSRRTNASVIGSNPSDSDSTLPAPDSCLLSPDFSKKLQNEPTSEQPASNEVLADDSAAAVSPAAPITPASATPTDRTASAGPPSDGRVFESLQQSNSPHDRNRSVQ